MNAAIIIGACVVYALSPSVIVAAASIAYLSPFAIGAARARRLTAPKLPTARALPGQEDDRG